MTLIPGDLICGIEEFAPAEGTYEENDSIYASIVGEKSENAQKRIVGVNGRGMRGLAMGDIVYGKVMDVYDAVALIQFEAANPHLGAHSTYCYLRISEVKHGYAETFREYIRIGDLVKARVKDVTPLGIHVTIADRELGVIKPACTRCRGWMSLRGENAECPVCGNRERRKAALS